MIGPILSLSPLHSRDHMATAQRVLATNDWYENESDDDGSELQNGIATLTISGPMLGIDLCPNPIVFSTPRGTAFVREMAANPECKGLLIEVASGGGDVSGVQELCAAIRSFGKPVAAYIHCACSAAYWAISGAGKIYGGRTSQVGSLGTYAVLCDYSKELEQEGIKLHLVSTGEMKGAGADGVITEAYIEQVRGIVTGINDEFKADVASGRGVETAALFDGRVWLAKDPAARPLCEIGTKEDAVRFVADVMARAAYSKALAAAR